MKSCQVQHRNYQPNVESLSVLPLLYHHRIDYTGFVRQIELISDGCEFALRRLVVLAPSVWLGMVGLSATGLVGVALLVGVSPIEAVSVFFHEATLALPDALVYLSPLGFSLAAIAGFGRWCLSRPDSSGCQSPCRLDRFVSSASNLWIPSDTARSVWLSITGIRQYLCSNTRICVSTSADLAGAAPRLN